MHFPKMQKSRLCRDPDLFEQTTYLLSSSFNLIKAINQTQFIMVRRQELGLLPIAESELQTRDAGKWNL